MIIYLCECGSKFIADKNTEESRKLKKLWKRKHDKNNKGHHWQRRVVRGRNHG